MKNFNCVYVQMEEYHDAADSYMGWCPHCQDFTRGQTEPDAESYDCEVCENHDVVGAGQALILGWIDFE